MEELKDYFEPVDHVLKTKYKNRPGFIGEQIEFSSDFNKSTIFLFGINETRNALGGYYDCDPSAIRTWLYQLTAFANLPICDLGNLKQGKRVIDTYASLKYVVSYIRQRGGIPIIFGGSHDITMGVLQGIMSDQEGGNVIMVDSRADIQSDADIHSQSFLQKIKQDYEQLIDMSLVGYQSYFVSPHQLEQLSNIGVDLFRLGSLRSGFNEVEPAFRDADFVSFDMSAIRYPDFEASENLSPNGLYAEEACQLANIAGLSDKMQVFLLSEYNVKLDAKRQSSHLSAQILWHVIFGISQRKGDYPAKPLSGYKKIYVNLERPDTELIFYQNESNQRYWIEIPINSKGNYKVVSCSESDYKAICNSKLPDRIWRKITQYLN